MANTILLIDDEVAIMDMLEVYLINEGYDVLKASSGKKGLGLLDEYQVDLVVLDIMMPEMDGLETCKKIRDQYNLPIIMLSAKSQDMDKIVGLGIGADDYLAKPFNPIELIARIKSQLRRFLVLNEAKAFKKEDQEISVSGLKINTKSHQVKLYDQSINLTPTEYKILLLLVENINTVYSTEEIFEAVWKEKYYESNNTVMAHIWRLREKIEENPKEPKIIKTVWGVGYIIEE